MKRWPLIILASLLCSCGAYPAASGSINDSDNGQKDADSLPSETSVSYSSLEEAYPRMHKNFQDDPSRYPKHSLALAKVKEVSEEYVYLRFACWKQVRLSLTIEEDLYGFLPKGSTVSTLFACSLPKNPEQKVVPEVPICVLWTLDTCQNIADGDATMGGSASPLPIENVKKAFEGTEFLVYLKEVHAYEDVFGSGSVGRWDYNDQHHDIRDASNNPIPLSSVYGGHDYVSLYPLDLAQKVSIFPIKEGKLDFKGFYDALIGDGGSPLTRLYEEDPVCAEAFADGEQSLSSLRNLFEGIANRTSPLDNHGYLVYWIYSPYR